MKKKARNSDEQALMNATLALYDCVLGERRWEEVMAGLLPYFKAATTTILTHDLDVPIGLLASGHAPPEMRKAYQEYYVHIDPQRQKAQSVPAGELLMCQNWWDDAYVNRSEIYQDFLIPNQARFAIGTKIAGPGSISANFALYRGTDAGSYTKEEQKLLSPVNQHMRRALTLMWRLQGLERKLFTQQQALDSLSFAVLVLDKAGCIRSQNRPVEDLVKVRAVFNIRYGELRCTSTRDQSALQALLSTVIDQGIGSGMQVVDGRNGNHWNLWSVPAHDGFGFAEERLAVLVISDAKNPADFESIVRSAFGFTATEAKLAKALANGVTVSEYAEQEQISMSTVRTHVRAVLTKANVKRQADLIRLLNGASALSGKRT